MSNDDTNLDKPLSKKVFDNIKNAEKFQKTWQEQAVTAYDFYAGHQWSEEDLARLREEERPAITFNRTVRVVNAVIGIEIQNRQTVSYTAREQGDAITSELLTGAVDWVRDNTDAEDEESQAFKDCVICGMGWTETRLSYESDPDGEIIIDRVDPLEMSWDPSARKRNLEDTRWRARKKKYSKEDFKEIWPDAELFQEGQNDMYNLDDNVSQPIDVEEARFYRSDQSNDLAENNNKITVVQYQWWEREIFYRIDVDGEIETKSEKEFKKIKSRVELLGLTWVRQTKRKFKQAFFYGKEKLDEGDCPINMFTFNCMTGLTDRNNNSWFGLLKLIHDPQMYANKWLSQILYILNSNPSGGYFYEKGAIADLSRFQNDISHPAKNVQLQPGGLGKLQPKVKPDYPQGIDRLLGFAVESVNELVGINLELLGAANRDQAVAVEEGRKQAGITILADFFDGLRKYRKTEGRVLADFVLNYISDGRLIKIEGDEMAQYVPLLRDKLDFKYDIVVDAAPTSQNTQQRTFETLVSMLPQLMQAGIPVPPEIIDFSPLPADLKIKWKKQINEQKPDEMETLANEVKKKLAELEIASKEQALEQGKVDIKKTQADVAKTYADTGYDITKAMRERSLTEMDSVKTQKEVLESVLKMLDMSGASNNNYL